MTKTCVSCRYIDLRHLHYHCTHPSLPVSVAVVTGFKQRHDCWDVRNRWEHCGPDGKWWEPKLSLWNKLKARVVVLAGVG